MSTSTRNFPNRLGKNTNVFLGSAELAAICSKLGRIPTVAEYHAAMGIINQDAANDLPLHELRPDRGVRRDRRVA
jgi:aconitate hydratase 2/2-methylisocitrate dehydratase